jgi:hypothetical protein
MARIRYEVRPITWQGHVHAYAVIEIRTVGSAKSEPDAYRIADALNAQEKKPL